MLAKSSFRDAAATTIWLSSEGIPVALIKRSDSNEIARNAIALDLGNLEAEGDAILKHAAVQAQNIIEEANRERKTLIDNAEEVGQRNGYEQGHKTGYSKGLELGRKEAIEDIRSSAQHLIANWKSALTEFESKRSVLMEDAKEHILLLACDIAKRVTGRQVEMHPESIGHQLEEILKVALQPTKLQIYINPEDETYIAEVLPKLELLLAESSELEVRTDPNLSRGSCVARTTRQGIIDASLETKLDRIVKALLPSEKS